MLKVLQSLEKQITRPEESELEKFLQHHDVLQILPGTLSVNLGWKNHFVVLFDEFDNKDVNINGIQIYRRRYEVFFESDGTLSCILQFDYFHRENVEQMCQLKKSPAIVEGRSLSWSRTVGCCLDGEEIPVRSISWISNSHDPLQKYDNHNDEKYPDKYIRVPEFDHNELKAFIFCRFAWGMNILYAFLSIEDKCMYVEESHNWDHPEGIALRRLGNDQIEIFLTKDDDIETQVYPTEREHKVWSGWCNFEMTEHFERLKRCMHLFYLYPNAKSLDTLYMETIHESYEILGDANSTQERLVQVLRDCKEMMKPTSVYQIVNRDPDLNNCIARCLCRLKRYDECVQYLHKCLEKRDWISAYLSDYVDMYSHPGYINFLKQSFEKEHTFRNGFLTDLQVKLLTDLGFVLKFEDDF